MEPVALSKAISLHSFSPITQRKFRYQRNRRQEKQNVQETTQRLIRDHADKPECEKDYKQRPQHCCRASPLVCCREPQAQLQEDKKARPFVWPGGAEG
jgi:hypothetical protein